MPFLEIGALSVDSEPEAWRSGVPKRVQHLLEKITFCEGCHLALNISEPGEVDQLVPIRHSIKFDD